MDQQAVHAIESILNTMDQQAVHAVESIEIQREIASTRQRWEVTS